MISPQTTIPTYFHALLEDLTLANAHLEAAGNFYGVTGYEKKAFAGN
jgi:hypothetical protein